MPEKISGPSLRLMNPPFFLSHQLPVTSEIVGKKPCSLFAREGCFLPEVCLIKTFSQYSYPRTTGLIIDIFKDETALKISLKD